MKTEKNVSLWTMVAVTLVVAVIASVVTANITGNLVTVKGVNGVRSYVYSKSEIDKMMNCKLIDVSPDIDGNKACSKEGYKFCQSGYVWFNVLNLGRMIGPMNNGKMYQTENVTSMITIPLKCTENPKEIADSINGEFVFHITSNGADDHARWMCCNPM